MTFRKRGDKEQTSKTGVGTFKVSIFLLPELGSNTMAILTEKDSFCISSLCLKKSHTFKDLVRNNALLEKQELETGKRATF